MKFHLFTPIALASSALVACATTTPGAHPQDMSAAQHEQAAHAQEGQAAGHTAQYNPNAQEVTHQCGSRGNPCWTSTTNPTKEHLAEADTHRKMAADHRAASQALRDAEASACAGISDQDRDTSPFTHREDITSVQPAYSATGSGKGGPTGAMIGAVVTFRAVQGLTAEWFQRLVECHVARNNVMGADAPDMQYCPLAVKGVTATVSSAGDGFAVKIEAKDEGGGKEVLRRAQALKNAS